ncbi:DNA primase [Streptomyces sp. NPDC006332]|uniref:DNA primase n=1 Tax=Streptomyces sp. NPDC006332 TaxID=3155456 RepID=UPI0033AFD045
MNRTAMGLAVGAGYLLGRTKKMKLAFAVGSLVAGKKMNLTPKGVAELVSQQLQNNPQFKEIGDQLRQDLRGVGKAASGAMVERQIDAIADRLHGRTAQVRDQLSGVAPDVGAEDEDSEDEERDEYEEPEAEESDEGDEGDDEATAEDEDEDEGGEAEEEPRRKPAARKAPAKKAPGKKAPAKKPAAARKTPARKAPVKKTAAKKTASKQTAGKKTAAARSAGRGARRLPKGGGE